MLRLRSLNVIALVGAIVVVWTLVILLKDSTHPYVPNMVKTPMAASKADDVVAPNRDDTNAEAKVEQALNDVLPVEDDGGRQVMDQIAQGEKDKEHNLAKDNESPAQQLEEAEHQQEIKDSPQQQHQQQIPLDDSSKTGALKYFDLVRDPANQPTDGKVRAAFVTLARNEDLYQLIASIKGVEDRFNSKFHYDWVFLNDKEFTDEFKRITTALISGKTKYGVIPKEHWSYPEFIDQEKAALTRKQMKEDGIIYGDLELYRHMCRFELGFFWRNPLMEEYDWYWRVEPDTTIHCDLNYDLFKYMQDHNKVYGFVISIHEFEKTIKTLWKTLMLFVKDHPDYVADDNLMGFISGDNGETYNLCHYWSNFEVANLNFWRSQPYREYFEHLDKAGGFFYERWGDAPIHLIAASLFLPKDLIHYFEDVGYRHGVYTQCPVDLDYRVEHKCYCDPKKDFTYRGYSCGKKWADVFGVEKMKGWENFT